MPLSTIAFNQQSGRAGRDGKPATIHLLCNEEDAQTNNLLIARSNPSRADLIVLYRALQRQQAATQHPEGLMPLDDEALRTACVAAEERFALDEAGVAAGRAVLGELGLLQIFAFGSEQMMRMPPATGKVDLQGSSRYLEGQETLLDFERFRQWFLQAGPDELLAALNRPIAPTQPEAPPAEGGPERSGIPR
jgi:single-stranded-DNA-specific exonuclease